MRTVIGLVTFVLVVACVTAAVYLSTRTQAAVRELSLSILRTLPRTFLVLETHREVAVATVNDGTLLMGPRLGQATATRRTHTGIDLDQISSKDISVDGRRVSIQLPTPSLFDSAVERSSVRVLAKRSGLQALRDAATSRSIEAELLDLLDQKPPSLSQEELAAQRKDFVDRLNRDAGSLFEAQGLSIEFQ